MMNNKLLHLLLLLTLLLTTPLLTTANESSNTATNHSPPKKVLFIGNSFTYYNNSIHYHLEQLVKNRTSAADFKDYNFRMATISGGFMREHEASVRSLVNGKRWNTVVLQGHSTEAITPKLTASFRKATKTLAGIARDNHATPVLFMTWAYSTSPSMIDQLSIAYTQLGKTLNVKVVPAGLGFSRALKERPTLILHAKDTKHPSIAGTYLAACIFYAVLYKQSPVNNPYIIDGLDKDDAAFLQRIAWETVESYEKAKNEGL